MVAAAEVAVMLLLKKKKKRSKKKKLTWEAVWICLAETAATEATIRSCREIWFSLLINSSILASTKHLLEHAVDFSLYI